MRIRIVSSGLLSKDEIKAKKLVSSDFDEKECLQAASYDLRLGSKHYLYEEAGNWNAVFLGEPEELKNENNNIKDPALILRLPHHGSNKLIIPPFGSAIIELKETIDLLSIACKEQLLIAGRFDLKLKAIYKGLISQQATQVEPCYKGKLYCFIHNVSSKPVVLLKDEKIATIEFSYVGQGLTPSERKRLIEKTVETNKKKFNSERFTPLHTGIEDIRWLHTVGMLPEECGIAPIYKFVQGNVREAVEANLEKSDIIDKLTDRVGNRLSEKQNTIKIVFSLITAVITFFTTGFLIEVLSELRYFSEELSFFATQQTLSAASLKAIEEHTNELIQLRCSVGICAIIAVTVITALLFWLLFHNMRPKYEQKWIHKRSAKEKKESYLMYKKELKTERQRNKKLHYAKVAEYQTQGSINYTADYINRQRNGKKKEKKQVELDKLTKKFNDSKRDLNNEMLHIQESDEASEANNKLLKIEEKIEEIKTINIDIKCIRCGIWRFIRKLRMCL